MTGWRAFGASVRGPGHVASGLPNQDAWGWTRRSWGDVVVVSDGVGSKSKAEYGARAACRAVPRAVQHGHEASKASLAEIKARWLDNVAPFEPRDCAATCLYVVRPTSGSITVGVLGDGLVAVTKTDGGIEYVEHSKTGSFANITSALSDSTAEGDWRVVEFEQDQVESVTLCTDGIADDLEMEMRSAFFHSWIEHTSAIADVTAGRHLRTSLQQWPVPRHTDDKTMACLRRADPGASS
ncbi:PP2C family serine/threonine-protein phosphatase [Cellulomonas humilata]|uniref:Serine/threonine protein phosphatase PrpC n=1 Tax=Cellulomonas humilata TaxID=144055 RepID=A0ABU0EL28_9CELL|nr:PP2C family serine/threonine-protein phosphatase [Cellulomonas humilata]MDQ0375989.1 serine/threonine protein phosphatase PrpC [Cellulomonas humilata]